jgi:hypothetical protein
MLISSSSHKFDSDFGLRTHGRNRKTPGLRAAPDDLRITIKINNKKLPGLRAALDFNKSQDQEHPRGRLQGC